MYTFDFYGTKRKKILDKKEKIIKFKLGGFKRGERDYFR